MNRRSPLAILGACVFACPFSGSAQTDVNLRDRIIALLSDDLGGKTTDAAGELGSILKASGWPTRKMAGSVAEQAVLSLVEKYSGDNALIELAIRTLSDAVTHHEAERADLATLVDLSRITQGRPQVYGTQYRWEDDGHLSLLPVENPAQVDKLRALVGLPTLHDQEQALGIAPISENELFRGSVQGFRAGKTKLEPAKGLNSKADVRMSVIYVHSRDDPRAHVGERATSLYGKP